MCRAEAPCGGVLRLYHEFSSHSVYHCLNAHAFIIGDLPKLRPGQYGSEHVQKIRRPDSGLPTAREVRKVKTSKAERRLNHERALAGIGA